jgi:hypothetical protein
LEKFLTKTEKHLYEQGRRSIHSGYPFFFFFEKCWTLCDRS